MKERLEPIEGFILSCYRELSELTPYITLNRLTEVLDKLEADLDNLPATNDVDDKKALEKFGYWIKSANGYVAAAWLSPPPKNDEKVVERILKEMEDEIKSLETTHHSAHPFKEE